MSLMPASIHSQFLHEVEAFLAETGMTPPTFGRQSAGDGQFVAELRDGRSPTLRTVDKVRGFMRAYRAEAGARS